MEAKTLRPAKQKFVAVDGDVADVLRDRIEYDGLRVRISGPRLDPKLYKRVDDVLKQFGGKWTAGKTQAHVFAQCQKDAILAAIGEGKILNRKQSFQFFETPDKIAVRLVYNVKLKPYMRVLEPSAGRGALIRAVQAAEPKVIITAVEIDANHLPVLDTYDSVELVINDDFLQTKCDVPFDVVVMNPPFSGGQDAEHVMHAFDFLWPGGQLAAIVGEGICTRSDKKAIAFQTLVQDHAIHEERLNSGEFKESGTLSNSRIIVLEKD